MSELMTDLHYQWHHFKPANSDSILFHSYLSVPFSCVTRYCKGLSFCLSSAFSKLKGHGFSSPLAALSFLIAGDSSFLAVTIRRIFIQMCGEPTNSKELTFVFNLMYASSKKQKSQSLALTDTASYLTQCLRAVYTYKTFMMSSWPLAYILTVKILSLWAMIIVCPYQPKASA